MFILILTIQALAKTELPSGECEDDDLCTAYTEALNIAKTPTTERILKSLTAIRESSSKLKFDAEGRVLLETATAINHFPYPENYKFQLKEETWFTAFPDIQHSCKFYNTDDKTLRMKQQLGLPPTYTITGVAQIYVDLEDIFRPCPDPEFSDMECVVSIPVKNDNSTEPEVPWYCPSEGEDVVQVGEKWSKVSNEQFTWMCNNWIISYTNDEVYDNYPWTGLGYTLDWGTEDGYGLSEFVVPAGATVVFHKKYTVDDYCSL